jgi:hypothetical protein
MKWLAVVVLFSAFAALAQDPNAACTIEGQVVNALTGEPLAKARVKLREIRQGGHVYSISTDSGGAFVLRSVTAATYYLSAEHNGYLVGLYGSRRVVGAGTPLALKPGQEMRELVIRLTPQGVIMGRILDEDGEPVARVEIHVMQFNYVAGRRQLGNVNSASTNDLGEYRIFALQPGRYYLNATYLAGPDAANGDLKGEEAYAPTYYPGTYDPASAGALEIAGGTQLRGIDMMLARTRTVRVRGRVSGAVSPGPGRYIGVSLAHNNSPDQDVVRNGTTVFDPQGNFELRGVTPGSYIITAQAIDEGRRFRAQMPMEVGNSNIDNVSLALAPGVDLTGQITVEGTANVRLAGLMVVLSGPEGTGGGARGMVREKGVLTFQGVLPDHYQLHIANLPENVYIKSIRLGTEDALDSGLNLTRGAAGPIEVLLSSNGGQIDGTVLNAQQQPAVGATVALVPESRFREQMRLFKEVVTDSTGHFSVKGIAPGDYKLFAWEEVEAGAYEDPDFLKTFEKLGESFSIHEGSKENAQLKVIPAER